jgi:S1-C subfamily serine protease
VLAPFVFALLAAGVEHLDRYSYSPVDRSSIVLVEVERAPVDLTKPWARQDTVPICGTGSILQGHRILTAAHVIGNAVTIDVARADRGEYFRARLVAVWHDVDLAVLTVDNPRFFEGSSPLELQDMQPADEEWFALGFPHGKLEYASGRFSEVNRATYYSADLDNLKYTVDMVVEPGYSGGPLMSDGRQTGVIVSGLDSEKKTYAVPSQVVRHLLKDLEDGHVDGAPSLIGSWQGMENQQIRAHYGLKDNQTGILVRSVLKTDTSNPLLQRGDVILAIDGCDVENDGMSAVDPATRVSFEYLFDRKQVGDTVTVELLRDRKRMTMKVPLIGAGKNSVRLVRYLGEETPSYLVVGGFVFSPLTGDYVHDFDSPSITYRAWIHQATLAETFRTPGEPPHEAIALVHLLPDATTEGYDDCIAHVVTHVNGRSIGSMRDLTAALDDDSRDYHHILLQPDGREIILSKAVLGDRQQAILDRHGVPADRSDDLGVETAVR